MDLIYVCGVDGTAEEAEDEVLAVWWGCRTQEGHRLQVWERRTPTRPLLAKAHYGARYQAARVSTSKAFKRLHDRGLAQRDYYRDAEGYCALGLVLTEEGLAPARQALAHFGPQWERAYLASQGRG